MRINVAAFGSRTFTGALEVESSDASWNDILLVCLPRHFDVTDLDEQWQRLDPVVTTHAQAIFLRVHPGDETAYLPRDGLMAPGLEVLRRRARVPLYVVAWAGAEHQISLASVPEHAPGATGHARTLLAHMARAELTTYANDPRGRLPENDSFHYEGPNGQHYRSFLRVQSILRLPDQLDAAAFWLLPFVEERTVVLLDSSTISVVGLHLAQYVRETGLETDRQVAVVHPMRGYDDELVEVAHRQVEAALPNPEHRTHALVLVSVVGTGSLALRGRTLAERLRFDQITSVGIFGAGNEDQALQVGRLNRILAQLDDDLGRVDASDCQKCRQDRRGSSPALIIGRDSYQVEISHPIAAELNINAFNPAIDFMGRYEGSNAFTVHRDEPVRGLSRRPRHHGVYIDVSILQNEPEFIARFRDKARRLRTSVDVILTPQHDAAVTLGDKASKYTGLPVINRNAEEFHTLDAGERELLSTGRVLIVDDAIISGSRLRGYRLAMLSHDLSPTIVHVLVGVCRPTSRKMRQTIANLVHQMGESERTLHSVEDLLLPNMDENDCPWCWERSLLHDYGRRGEEIASELIDRAEVLNGNGLTTGLFWGLNDATLPLGPESVLGSVALTDAQIFASVASGLQWLRSEGKLDAEFTPPVAKVLDPAFWADGRFYAEPITASILRAANKHDLTAPIAGREFSRAMQTRWEEAPSANLRIEMLLATIAGKLPILPGMYSALEDERFDPLLFDFFLNQLWGGTD